MEEKTESVKEVAKALGQDGEKRSKRMCRRPRRREEAKRVGLAMGGALCAGPSSRREGRSCCSFLVPLAPDQGTRAIAGCNFLK